MIGKKKANKYIKASFVALILNFIVIFNLININFNGVQNNFYDESQLDNINLFTSGLESYTLEWIDNGEFDPLVTEWFNETEGDTSDVNASLSDGFANLELLGNSGSFSSAEIYPNASEEWRVASNPAIPLKPFLCNSPGDPTYGINEYGWWARHEWDQKTIYEHYQVASIHWKRNFTLEVNMADYKITSVTINATVNGTVYSSPSQGGGIDVPGDESSLQQWANYDTARFYILASDIQNTKTYELAYNKTKYLGLDSEEYQVGSDYFHDMEYTQLTAYSEDVLIAYMESIFQSAPGNQFTLTLGIDFNCEDNEANDEDFWDDLRFINVNVSFTYEKKMNRYAAVAWSQEGDIISTSEGNTQIDNATLRFNLKTNKKFTSDSPNSEVRAVINGNKFLQTIKLSEINTTSDNIVLDVTPIITAGINITTSIQLMLLDNFVLNETIIISIDNISLWIKYSILQNLIETDYELILNNETGIFIEIPWGEIVNITLIYKEQGGSFISNATVELRDFGAAKNFTENEVFEYYNYSFDTSLLEIGSTLLQEIL